MEGDIKKKKYLALDARFEAKRYIMRLVKIDERLRQTVCAMRLAMGMGDLVL